MNNNLLRQLHNLLARGRQKQVLVRVLACAVVFWTTYALILPAITLSKENHVIDCQYVAHTHSADCYQLVTDENGSERKELVCGQADWVVHEHNSDCYAEVEGEKILICPLPEIAKHTHTKDCYEENDVLTCEDESAEHQHDESCFETQEVLTCGGYELHQHNKSCYEDGHEGDSAYLTCGKLEVVEHTHGTGCLKNATDEEVFKAAAEAAQLRVEAAEELSGEGFFQEELLESEERAAEEIAGHIAEIEKRLAEESNSSEENKTQESASDQKSGEDQDVKPDADGSESSDSMDRTSEDGNDDPQRDDENRVEASTDDVDAKSDKDVKSSADESKDIEPTTASYSFGIRGIHEISLTEITEQVGVNIDVQDIKSVKSRNKDNISIEVKEENSEVSDYILIHKLPFFDTVRLDVGMKDKSEYHIILTDEDNDDLAGYKVRTLEDGTVVFDLNPDTTSKGLRRAPARNADGSVQTIANPAGTTIDLFDYWVYGDTPNDNWPWYVPGISTFPGLSGVGNELGINKDHAIKFEPASDRTVYDGTKPGSQTYDGESRHPNVTGQGGINAWTGSANPLQGMVENTLGDDGYPKSTNNSNIGTNGESLAYLFNNSEFDGKKAYMGTDQIFHVDDDGYYVYDSDDNSATYDASTNTYKVGDGNGGFWPFGQGSYWFGVHMSTPFSQPQNGLVLNPSGQYMPMTYSFSGDDDVWIYIDGVLIGDAGGIHSATDLDIDFQTGEVRINGVKTGTLKSYFEAAEEMDTTDWDGDTFRAGTYHTMDFFYLERGAGASNMKMRYNMVSTADFTAHKSYVGVDSSDLLKRDQFQFELIGLDGKYTRADDGTLTLIDATAPAIMPSGASSHSDGSGTVADPKFQTGVTQLSNDDAVNSQIYTVGDTEDGNVNFGMTRLSSENCKKGDTYRYIVREVIPDGGTENPDGTYTYNGVVYDRTVYYMSASVTSWVTNGIEEYGLSKRYYTDDTYTKLSDVTFINFTNKNTDADTPILYIEPVANKELHGKRLSAGQFTFLLKDSNGKILQEKTNDGIGKIEFDKVTFDKPGTYLFYITEVNDGQEDYEYDKHDCILTVNVIKNANNTYSVTTHYSNNTFENTYTKEVEEGVTIQTTKLLDGRELKANEFSFLLQEIETDSSGNIRTDVQGDAVVKSSGKTVTATNRTDGTISFPLEQVFTKSDFPAGSETIVKAFKITEVIPDSGDKLEGVVYDEDGVVYAFVQASYNASTGEIFVYEPQYSNDISGAFLEGTVGYPVWTASADNKLIGNLTVDVSSVTLGADGIVRLMSTESGDVLTAIPDENGAATFSLDFSEDTETTTHAFTIFAGEHVAPVKLNVTPGTSGSEGGSGSGGVSGTGNDGDIQINGGNSDWGHASAGDVISLQYHLNNYRYANGNPETRHYLRYEIYVNGNNKAGDYTIYPEVELSNRTGEGDNTHYDVELTYKLIVPDTVNGQKVSKIVFGSIDDGPHFDWYQIGNSGTPGKVEVADFADTYQAASFNPVFTNYYVEPAKQSITIHKVLEGGSLSAGQFEFILKDSDGSEVARAYNDAEGNVTFEDVVEFTYGEFTDVNSVTKKYTVEEVIPGTAKSKTIDGTIYPNYTEADGIAYTDDTIDVAVTGRLKNGTIYAGTPVTGGDEADQGVLEATYIPSGDSDLSGTIIVDTAGVTLDSGRTVTISPVDNAPEINPSSAMVSGNQATFAVTFSEAGDYKYTLSAGHHRDAGISIHIAENTGAEKKFSVSYKLETEYGNKKIKNLKFVGDEGIFISGHKIKIHAYNNPGYSYKESNEVGNNTVSFEEFEMYGAAETQITDTTTGVLLGEFTFNFNTGAHIITGKYYDNSVLTDQTTSQYYDNYSGVVGTDTLTNITVERKSLAIKVIKVDQSGNSLEGATFELRLGSETGVQQGSYTSTLSENEAIIYTNSDIPSGTYYLVETNPPSGFVKLEEPVVINIADTGAVTVTGIPAGNIRRVDGVYVIKVMNVEEGSYELPSTGGSGTTLFTILGSILIALAGVMLVRGRRTS